MALLTLWAGPALAQEFAALSESQQDLLEPLAEAWDRIPDARRQRLIEMADRVAGQPPQAQERFRNGLQRFLSLDPARRHAVREIFERFRHLPDEERERIVQRVMTMPEEERRAFALGMRTADRTQRLGGRLEEYLRGLPPDRRRALLADLEGLSPPDKLRRLADELEAAPNATPEPNTQVDPSE